MSVETRVNVPLLRKVVEWVEWQKALPNGQREWNQMSWILQWDCGTQCCVAGKLALDDGWRPVWIEDTHSNSWAAKVSKHGVCRDVADVATDLLGIHEREADRLFHGCNTAADIRRIAENIAGESL